MVVVTAWPNGRGERQRSCEECQDCERTRGREGHDGAYSRLLSIDALHHLGVAGLDKSERNSNPWPSLLVTEFLFGHSRAPASRYGFLVCCID